MKYRCKECQTDFSDEGEANFHAYEVHSMEFEDCIQVLEEETLIEDTPEETPSDIDSMTEEQLKTKAKAVIATDAYMNSELSETEEKMLISRLMGLTTGKAHDKAFAEKVTTSNAIQKAYQHLIESLQDESMLTCPICHELWENLAKKETTILSEEKTKVGVPLSRLIHLKMKHENIWNMIKGLFGISAEEIPDERVSTTPNPENVSAREIYSFGTIGNPEELSSEELAEVISSDQILRKQFFKEWLRRLQNKE